MGVSPSYCVVNPQSANQLYVVDLTPTVAIVQDDVWLILYIYRVMARSRPSLRMVDLFNVPILDTSLNPIVPGNTVVVYDTSTNTPVGNPITVGTSIYGISPDGYFANDDNRSDKV